MVKVCVRILRFAQNDEDSGTSQGELGLPDQFLNLHEESLSKKQGYGRFSPLLSRDRLREKLHIIQLLVKAALSQKFLMSPGFHYPTVIDDQQFIRIDYGG